MSNWRMQLILWFFVISGAMAIGTGVSFLLVGADQSRGFTQIAAACLYGVLLYSFFKGSHLARYFMGVLTLGGAALSGFALFVGVDLAAKAFFGAMGAVSLVVAYLLFVSRDVKNNLVDHTDSIEFRDTAYLALGFSLALAAAIVSSFLAYDEPIKGFVLSVTNIAVIALICVAAGFFLNKRTVSKKLYGIALLAAAAVFTLQKSGAVFEKFDEIKTNKSIARSKTDDERIAALQSKSDSKFSSFLAEIFKMKQARATDPAFIDLNSEITNLQEFVCEDTTTSNSIKEYSNCETRLSEKVSRLESVKPRVNSYFLTQSGAMIEKINDLWKSFGLNDQRTKEKILREISSGNAKAQGDTIKLIDSFINYNNALKDVYAFLKKKTGAFEIRDNQIQFKKEVDVEAFNQLISKQSQAADELNKTSQALSQEKPQ